MVPLMIHDQFASSALRVIVHSHLNCLVFRISYIVFVYFGIGTVAITSLSGVQNIFNIAKFGEVMNCFST